MRKRTPSRNSMSRNETFIPRHMALDLLASEQMRVGAKPQIADAGDQVRVERRARADIDRRDEGLEALEILRLIDGEIAHPPAQAEHRPDHAQIDHSVPSPAPVRPLFPREADRPKPKPRRHTGPQ